MRARLGWLAVVVAIAFATLAPPSTPTRRPSIVQATSVGGSEGIAAIVPGTPAIAVRTGNDDWFGASDADRRPDGLQGQFFVVLPGNAAVGVQPVGVSLRDGRNACPAVRCAAATGRSPPYVSA
jgi:hypothetical protein